MVKYRLTGRFDIGHAVCNRPRAHPVHRGLLPQPIMWKVYWGPRAGAVPPRASPALHMARSHGHVPFPIGSGLNPHGEHGLAAAAKTTTMAGGRTWHTKPTITKHPQANRPSTATYTCGSEKRGPHAHNACTRGRRLNPPPHATTPTQTPPHDSLLRERGA